jgi:hypothetical protein
MSQEPGILENHMSGTNPQTFFRRTADGMIDGPHLGGTLKRMALAGTLSRDDLLSRSETGPWVPAHRVQGLLFKAEAPPPPEPPQPPPVHAVGTAASTGTPPSAACAVEAALRQLLQSEGKAIRPSLTSGPTSGIPVLEVIETAALAIEAIGAAAQLVQGLPVRLHAEILLCEQVEPTAAQEAAAAFGDAFPRGERVLAVMKNGFAPDLYVTTNHLLLQVSTESGSLTSLVRGLLKSTKHTVLQQAIPLRRITQFEFIRAGSAFDSSDPTVHVNGKSIGHVKVQGDTVFEKTKAFARVVEVAAHAARHPGTPVTPASP